MRVIRKVSLTSWQLLNSICSPIKRQIKDPETRKKVKDFVIDVAINYAEAKAAGRGDEFMTKFKRSF